MKPLKVLIYEDNNDLREMLQQILELADGIEFLAGYPNCNEVKNQMDIYQPDVVLMDIDMPGINGIDGTTIIKQFYPDVQVLMLTVFEEEDKIFDAICAGANGYLLKRTPPEKIINAIFDVMNGDVPLTPFIARKMLQVFPKMKQQNPKDEYKLTDREQQILSCLVKGLSYKLIAVQLDISIDTVRSHIKKVYEKLHVNSATEAVSKVMKGRNIK
jgi:DNA-binding NarL/FixJ family response regulator